MLQLCQKKNEQGLSLLGVLIAVLLLVASITTVTALMARTQKNVRISQEKFVAANLAREGLELVQAERDNNWFAADPAPCVRTNDTAGRDECWVKNICGATGDQTGLNTFTIDRTGSGAIVLNPDPALEQQKLYRKDEVWSHELDGGPTVFSRVITADCSTLQSEPQTVAVQADVTWQSNQSSTDSQVTVKEILYNWYKP